MNEKEPYDNLDLAQRLHQAGNAGKPDLRKLKHAIELIDATIQKLLSPELQTLEKVQCGTLELLRTDSPQERTSCPQKEDTASKKTDTREEERREEKKRGEEKNSPLSGYYQLAQRIIESAASLDAPKVGLNKDTSKQREKRIQESAEDVRKLIEISWKPWDAKEALKLANEIWNWVLKKHKEDPRTWPGLWRKNIKSGYKFRRHCDSGITYKKNGEKKQGGKLLEDYRESLEYEAKREAEARARQAARMKAELKTVENEEKAATDEEMRLAKIRKEQGDEAWARTLIFEMLGFKDLQTIKADPFLGQSPRVKKAIKILEKAS